MAWIQGSVPVVQWALTIKLYPNHEVEWLLGKFPPDLFSLPFEKTSNFHSNSYFTFTLNRLIHTRKPENKKKNGTKIITHCSLLYFSKIYIWFYPTSTDSSVLNRYKGWSRAPRVTKEDNHMSQFFRTGKLVHHGAQGTLRYMEGKQQERRNIELFFFSFFSFICEKEEITCTFIEIEMRRNTLKGTEKAKTRLENQTSVRIAITRQ